MGILRNFDPDMDPAGVDEAYLKWVSPFFLPGFFLADVGGSITEYCASHEMDPQDCVREIRRIIFEETKLTASAGIAPNKVSSHFLFLAIIK